MISQTPALNSFTHYIKPSGTPLCKEPRNNFAMPLVQDAFQKNKKVSFGATTETVQNFESEKQDMRDFIAEGIAEAHKRTRGNFTAPKNICIVGPFRESGSSILSVYVPDGVMYGRALSAENKNRRCFEAAEKILNSSLFKKGENGATFLSQLPNGADYDELTNILRKLKENPASASMKEIQFISCNMSKWLSKAIELPFCTADEDRKFLENCIVSPYRNIFHELGHLAHFESLNKNWELYHSMDKDNGALTREFKNNPKKIEIAKKITNYAAQSPDEFVAEVYADVLEGKKIPEDVMELYREYRGPKVPKITIPEGPAPKTYF